MPWRSAAPKPPPTKTNKNPITVFIRYPFTPIQSAQSGTLARD
jgi:hypothetical protein